MVRFSPGDGLLHVRPGVVLLTAGDDVVRRAVLELLDDATESAPDDPIPSLVRRLAVQIAGESTVPEALAVVARTGDQVLLWLFGGVVAELGDGPDRFDASERITWVEQLVPLSDAQLSLTLTGQPAGDLHYDVTLGTVPAGAAHLVLDQLSAEPPATRRRERPLKAERPLATPPPEPVSAPSPPEPAPVPRDEETTMGGGGQPSAPVPQRAEDPSPQSPETADATFLPPARAEEPPGPREPAAQARPVERVAPPPGSSIIDLRDPDVPVREPLPRIGSDTAPPPDVREDAAAHVRGVLCPVEHLNDPRARYCSSCGRAMVHTRLEVEGVRPPLGVLVLDDGRTFGLATDYVVGRHPEDDGEVAAGRKRPLALTDSAVSTIHAEFILRDWDVQVVDRASRNGTFVSEDDGETWQRLDADEPRTIRPGAQVSFASRIATFETSHRPGG